MEIAIPAGITEEQVKEWIGVLVERKINADLNSNPAVASATAKAKTDIRVTGLASAAGGAGSSVLRGWLE